MWHGLALLGLFWLFYLGFSLRMPDPTLRRWVVGLSAGGLFLLSLGFWFVVSFRAHQIESRLRELDERDRAIAMAHQLAAAQIQPHFLFNSLAALQHWVQAKDDRAAPLLEALTGFLRATLPLFDQRLLRLADEAEAAQRYLAVMQLRLGERLRYRVQIEPAAATRPLAIARCICGSSADASLRSSSRSRATTSSMDAAPGQTLPSGSMRSKRPR